MFCSLQIKTMSSNGNNLYKDVPKFDGSNWLRYKEAITAVLMAQGLWCLITRAHTRPADLDAKDFKDGKIPLDEGLKREEKQDKWDNDNDCANGILRLTITVAMRNHLKEGATSHANWTALSQVQTVTGATSWWEFAVQHGCHIYNQTPM